MQRLSCLFFLMLFFIIEISGQDLISTSVELLNRIKVKQETKSIIDKLNQFTKEDILLQLDTDEKKKVFWINIYNSFIILQLANDSSLYENRSNFFQIKRNKLAGLNLSFAEIEHSILRRSQFELGLGYITNPFASKFEKKIRVQNKDPRIHFVLNCGAISCPPVVVLQLENLEQQLEEATLSYLKATTFVNKDLVTTTTLMNWFRGDFGGKKGSLEFLQKYNVIDLNKNYILKYGGYDWSLKLDNFK